MQEVKPREGNIRLQLMENMVLVASKTKSNVEKALSSFMEIASLQVVFFSFLGRWIFFFFCFHIFFDKLWFVLKDKHRSFLNHWFCFGPCSKYHYQNCANKLWTTVFNFNGLIFGFSCAESCPLIFYHLP